MTRSDVEALCLSMDETLACDVFAQDIMKLPLFDLDTNQSDRTVLAACSFSSTSKT